MLIQTVEQPVNNKQIAKQQLEALQKNPKLFFTKVLGCETEDYQDRILQTVADNDRTAIAACHDVGKSWTTARLVLWFLSVFPGSKAITTAPTFNQVKNILWAEIRTAHKKSKVPLGGKMNLTDWHLSPTGDWFGLGFTSRNEATSVDGQGTSSSFQGFHAPHVLVVFDEATGIPPNIWTMAEGMMTSSSVKFVCIGNPTTKNSEFFKCFKSKEWAKVNLTCFDSPNLKASGILNFEHLKNEVEIYKTLPDAEAMEMVNRYQVVKPYLLTTKWVVQSVAKWGFNHPLTQGKVLGTFPEQTDGSLFTLGAVEEAQLRLTIGAVVVTEGDRKVIGVDVARFGNDSTVITVLHGKKQLSLKQVYKRDTNEVTGLVIQTARDLEGVDVIVVDETGLGAGVVDNLRQAVSQGQLPSTCEIRGVQFGAMANDADTPEAIEDRKNFVNIKARMFSLLADDIKNSNGLGLLDEEAYLQELPQILYKYDSKGRMQIESKDEFKRRTAQPSPDRADSLALANFGRYETHTSGMLTDDFELEFAVPFASSLGSNRNW